MNKIDNYEDLVLERKRLEAELVHYKSVINGEVNSIKQKFAPISDVLSFFATSPTRSPNNKLLQVGTDIGIELLVRQKLLSKAGWLTKLVLPYILKKVSSKAIEKVHDIRN